MYFNKLKSLREYHDLTQEEIATILGCNRNTYKNWENNIVMIPIEIADRLSLFYKVSLSYLLGISENKNDLQKIKKMDYSKLLENLKALKKEYKITFNQIASKTDCTLSAVQKYYSGNRKIPIDRLIMFSELFNTDLDELCGKK